MSERFKKIDWTWTKFLLLLEQSARKRKFQPQNWLLSQALDKKTALKGKKLQQKARKYGNMMRTALSSSWLCGSLFFCQMVQAQLEGNLDTTKTTKAADEPWSQMHQWIFWWSFRRMTKTAFHWLARLGCIGDRYCERKLSWIPWHQSPSQYYR